MKSERLKKWLSSTVFGLLGLVVIGYSIKLAYDVMAILFPNDPVLKFMAIALFDGGVIGWLLAYVGKAKGTPQRGISLLMVVLDFIGVAVMAVSGIYLGGQTLAQIPTWVGGTVVVVTAVATILNAGGYYYYHANGPEVLEAIQAQELEDDLNEEALSQARYQVERKAQQLGAIMANRVTARMKYRLRLPMSEQESAEWQGETIDAPAYDPAQLPPPPVQDETFWSAVKSFFGGKQSRPRSAGTPLKNSTNSQQTVSIENANETWGDRSGAIMGWKDTPTGRVRLWCLACRENGDSWTTPTLCEHIKNAKEEEKVSEETARNTRLSLIDEYGLLLEEKDRQRESATK